MKWKEDVKIIEQQIREAGCVSLVDIENERLYLWPFDKIPKAIKIQLALNDKKLGYALCADLLKYAGYQPDEATE